MMKKFPYLSSLVLSSLLIAANSAFAVTGSSLVVWSHPGADSLLREGALTNISPSSFSSPVVAEIDGNESNGKEVAIGSADGRLSVLSNVGQVLWTATLPSGNCGVPTIMSSPAVAKLRSGATPSVVIGYGGTRRNCDGGVAAFDGQTGALRWNFSTLSYSKQARFRENLHAVFSTPAIADVDGDGNREIGFGSFDRHVYLINSDGSIRWAYQAADTVWSSPAFADVDGLPGLEMIAATDISANKRIRPATQNGGILYAFRTKPRAKGRTMVRFRDPSLIVWQTALDQVLYSSPVIADVLPNNGTEEVIIGSGCYFPTNTAAKGGRWIKILSLRSGQVLQTLNSPVCSPSSVATGDLDGDGVPEIVSTVSGDASIGGDGLGRVLAWKAESPEPIWETVASTQGYNDRWLGQFSSPVISDLDGNGSLEVIVTNGAGLEILQGRTGAALTCADGGCSNSSINLRSAASRSTPAVGDLNGDGVLDLVSTGRSETGSGAIYRWSNFSQSLGSETGVISPSAAPYPMFRGNAERNGYAQY